MSKSIESFGKYLLLEKLASGGMAEVFLAKSSGASGIGKFVAVKRILPQYSENPEFIEMFKEEAKIAVNLNHGNVVSIFEFGVEKSQFYLVMEYVEGQNLRQVLNHMKKESKEFSLDQIVYMIKEVAAGLDHAHRCLDGSTGRPLNITHRDMSPQNVMISFEGEVKVVDFGIAKAETQVEHTRAGTIKGKFGYMSPEQADGQPIDQRTDVFSLGIVLWELLANERLFTAQSEAGTLRKIRECQIPSLRKINPAISPELERICNKALAKDKGLRYQTAAAFHRDLNRFLNTQFPEFSSQDFSIYMKSIYSQMFLENRKKLADYAKLTAASAEDKPAYTATKTLTNTENPELSLLDDNNSSSIKKQTHSKLNLNVGENSLKLNVHQEKVDLSSLRKNTNPAIKAKTSQPTTLATTNSINQPLYQPPQTQSGYRVPVGTQSSIYMHRAPDKPSESWTSYIIVLTILIAGGVFYYNQVYKEKERAEQALAEQSVQPVNQVDQASRQSVSINIQSYPQQAVVYIDDVSMGMTPYLGSFEMDKPFKVTLRKDGFLPYEVVNARANASGYSLMATMQPEPPMGYLAIEVINGGVNTIITVNGVKLSEKDPIGRYPVAANVPVTIKATNPFAQLSAESVVSVGHAQKKAVRLILSRQAGNTK